MKQLFIRFYLGVLAVLFLAWYIHGIVLRERTDRDRARVVTQAHRGGARLVANELDLTPPENRTQILNRLRQGFDYSVELIPLDKLPPSLQQQVSSGYDVLFSRLESGREAVFAVLPRGSEVVRLGPLPDFNIKRIEASIGGWMRLTADKLESASDREATLTRLQDRFDFPVLLIPKSDLPQEPRERIESGDDIVFYSPGSERWFAVTPLKDGANLVRFGPFPNFDRNEQKAATTTLALVLLPAALAIALLLRPITRQLRQVENAAKAIAAGDLSARVDERRTGSAKPLAQAFNNRANRTETLVRTQRELLQAVSHEFRTPLSRMRFAVDLIETAKDDTERKQRLDSLDAAVEDIDELVTELLRYVKMETAEPLVNKEHVAVQDGLDVLLPKYTLLHPSVDFRVSIQIDQGENSVFADRLGFQRVMGNLLSNAGRYAKCKVTVHVASSDGAITIDVDDDGCGIPESERERVFEPFVRLDDLPNETNRGVGLGLALVKRILSQHGGSVVLLTSPFGGCRARTVWPSDKSPELGRS